MEPVVEAPPPPEPIPVAPVKVECLPCDVCNKPVDPSSCPVVVEWGKKSADSPAHIGRPWKTVAHSHCVTGKPQAKVPAKTAAVKGEGSSSKKVGANPERGAAPLRSGPLSGKTIHRKRKDNPRKPGTHGYNSWEKIKDGMTYEAYIEAGGRPNDLRWDVDHGWVEVR